MDNKINDILKELEPDIDLSYTYQIKQIKPSELTWKTTNDIKTDLSNKDISNTKYSKIFKSKTKNFDSIVNSKKYSDIDLNEKLRRTNILKKYLAFIKLYFKYRKNHKEQVIQKIEITDYNIQINPEKENAWNIIKLKHFFSENLIFSNKFFLYFILIILLVFIVLIIDKFFVETKINSWYEKLLSIKDDSWNIEYIEQQVLWSKNDFFIWNILFTPFLLLPIEDVNNWHYILKWWKELTSIIEKSLYIYHWAKKFIDINWWIDSINLTYLLSNIKDDFWEIVDLIYNTIIYYNKITEFNNPELNEKLEFAKTKLKEIYWFLDIINKDYDVFLSLLWHNTERKYLVIFQNNDEIRPTWWFIWSLGTLTVRNWKIISFDKEDVYSYEWDINKVMTQKEPAPEWLNRITKTFWFRDSNYFISFEKSSYSLKSFIDKVNRYIDWIVYVNQNTVLDFLKYNWWVKFNELNEIITEDNFSLIISTLVEAKVFKVWSLWTPKQILFDFVNEFVRVLKKKNDYYAYMNIIMKNIKSRDIVFYSFIPEENNLLWKLWVNWKINYLSSLDFAYPVFTSISWNKSDRYIELKYKKNIIENIDCSIDTNLSIYRTHMFSKFAEEKVNKLLDSHNITNKESIINIQWRGDNKSYVRIILPKDAIIEQKEGMNIQKFDTFQQVDFYQYTRLLESTHYDINYKLPNIKCEKYSYKLYKQPWIRKFDIEITNWKNEVIKKWIVWDYFYNQSLNDSKW